ncbi:hypothetical protein Taro_000645, partial [Colocasia esculenta]|nr:hypothetical protein [Colocasia esculenta]
VCHGVGTVDVVVGEQRLTDCGLTSCGVSWWWHSCVCVSVVVPRGGRVYRLCDLRRCRHRLVPPAVVLVQLCELVLPRGMPQGRYIFGSHPFFPSASPPFLGFAWGP